MAKSHSLTVLLFFLLKVFVIDLLLLQGEDRPKLSQEEGQWTKTGL